MPPSGFSATEVLPVEQFLRACAQALKKEGTERQLTPGDAATGEVSSISNALRHSNFSAMESSILVLLKDFYSHLATAEIARWDDDYAQAVNNIILRYRERLLKLHI